jgi:hypothetical protein
MMNKYTKLLYLTAILNVADTICTIIAVRSGWAREVNPAMAFLLDHGNAAFIFGKTFIVVFSLALLWALLPDKRAVRALYVVSGVYCLLMVYTAAAFTYQLV